MSNNGIPPLNDWQADNYPVIYDEGNETSYYVKDGNKVEIAGGGSSYLVYTALLTQTGTDAPVATVLENTLGGTVVWSRNGVGAYYGTLEGVFLSGKTICPPFGTAVNNTLPIGFTTLFDYGYNLARYDNDRVLLGSYNFANFTAVELSTATTEEIFIEIRVYP